MSYYNSLVK